MTWPFGGDSKTEKEIEFADRSIAESLRHIDKELAELVELGKKLLKFFEPKPVPIAFVITQIGDPKMAITGITPGSPTPSQFAATPSAPAGATVPAGSTVGFSSDDPGAVLSAVAGDTTGLLVNVSVPASDTQGSAPAGSPAGMNLTFSAAMPPAVGQPQGPPVTKTVFVPYLAVVPPPPPPVPTAFDINQTI